jgi:hypothetical protein
MMHRNPDSILVYMAVFNAMVVSLTLCGDTQIHFI